MSKPIRRTAANNTRQTSAKVATKASKVFSDPKSTKAEKSVAASNPRHDLSGLAAFR